MMADTTWIRTALPSAFHSYLTLMPWQTVCVTCGEEILPGDWSWQQKERHRQRAIHDTCPLPDTDKEREG